MLFKTESKADEVAETDEADIETTAETPDPDNVAIDGDDDSPADDDRSASDPQQDADEGPDAKAQRPAKSRRQIRWGRVLTSAVLPGIVMLLALCAGFLKWQEWSLRASATARIESVQAAKDTTVALLSYQPDTADKELGAAANRLTGSFRKDYQDLINKVVIPGAKEQHISTTANVPAASSVSATPEHAVVLVFVDQTTIVGKNPPSDLVSTVRVTLDKVGGRWLISEFTPV